MSRKKHSQFCEGHVTCPTTKKEECGKAMIWRSDGVAMAVMCFGCDQLHNVIEDEKA